MWSTRATCLVLLISACVAFGWELQSRSSLTAPFFMWSDKQIFSTAQVVDTVSSGDWSNTLGSLFRVKDMDSNFINKNIDAPEVAILFVEPEMRTDEVPYIASAFATTPGGSLSHIKKAIENSASSVVMPYTKVDESSWVSILSSLLDSFEHSNANFFLTKSETNMFFRLRGLDGVKSVAVADLINELKTAKAFTNGVTDLVVVSFDTSSYAEHDSIIGDLVATIKAATKGNFVAVYSAVDPSADDLTWSFSELTTREFQENIEFVSLVSGTNNTNYSNTTTSHHKINYFPGPFIEVLLVCAVLITMLFTGACAIFSLQTPDKWEIPKVSKREF